MFTSTTQRYQDIIRYYNTKNAMKTVKDENHEDTPALRLSRLSAGNRQKLASLITPLKANTYYSESTKAQESEEHYELLMAECSLEQLDIEPPLTSQDSQWISLEIDRMVRKWFGGRESAENASESIYANDTNVFYSDASGVSVSGDLDFCEDVDISQLINKLSRDRLEKDKEVESASPESSLEVNLSSPLWTSTPEKETTKNET